MRFSVGEEARLLFVRCEASRPYMGAVGMVHATGPFVPGQAVHYEPFHGWCNAPGDYLFVVEDANMAHGCHVMTVLDGQLMKLGDPDAGIETHEAEEQTA